MIVARPHVSLDSSSTSGLRGCSYQEESIGGEGVQEDNPTHIASQISAMVGDRSGYYGDNDANEFVTTVGNQIVNLALTLNVQEVLSQPQDHQF